MLTENAPSPAPGTAPGEGWPASARWMTLVGTLVVAAAWLVYFASDVGSAVARPDFYFLADAFLHGRTWLEHAVGPQDTIFVDGRVYVPFAPFPAVVLLPLVTLAGPGVAGHLDSIVNASLAAAVVGLGWWVAGRIRVRAVRDRFLLVVLLGFSTQVWWVTTLGGVWHTGHLVAGVITLLLIGEMFGRRRAILLGLLLGMAFLSRAPVVFAAPAVALWLSPVPDGDRDSAQGQASGTTPGRQLHALPWASWGALALGLAPALAFFAWYNAVRFGTPFESGYGLAALTGDLAQQRARGLFSLVHVPMNVDYLFLKLPSLMGTFPFLKPDGYGMSVFVTSPGLLLAFRAPWWDRRSWLLLAAAAAVLVPTLLYYGGGFYQYGYRYFLDSIPFLWALVAQGVVHHGPFRLWHQVLIWAGVAVMAIGVYWAYHP